MYVEHVNRHVQVPKQSMHRSLSCLIAEANTVSTCALPEMVANVTSQPVLCSLEIASTMISTWLMTGLMLSEHSMYLSKAHDGKCLANQRDSSVL